MRQTNQDEIWAEEGTAYRTPKTLTEIRRAEWRKFFSRCAWVFFVALAALAVYVFASIAGAI